MNSKDVTFQLVAELRVEDGEIPEKNIFNIEYIVKLLDKNESKGVFRDKNLNINVENRARIEYLYQIETKNVDLSFCKRLTKGKDISRQLFYRYDWIHFLVSGSGKVLKIANKDSLVDCWDRLKSNIFKHYKGHIFEYFVRRINDDYKASYEPTRSVSQCLHFALLFPGIPILHNPKWKKTRRLRCSEYEKARFNETITYLKTENELRYYRLEGDIPEEYNTTNLHSYDGSICVPTDDIFPKETNLHIEYTLEGHRVAWSFSLTRKD